MREGFTFFRNHGDAARGAIATAIQRGGITALVLVALLLERNTFHLSSNPSAGLAGLAVALSFAGVGIVAGALIAPLGVKKYGRHLWMRYMLFGSALAPLPLAIWHLPIPLYFAVFFTSLFGQSLKVTNDALVQSKIDDGFRGRIFAFYDVMVNGAIVLGALATAMILPISGKSFLVPAAISIAYFLTGAIFLRRSRFSVPL